NVDPAKLLDVIKKLAADSGSAPAVLTSGSSAQDKEIEHTIEKDLAPQMQGEIAGAILSLKPLFDSSEMPAMVFAAKLKSKDSAQAMRAGKLFAKIKRLENTTVLGSPVVSLDNEGEAPFAIVTDDYFVLADSVATLKMLETKERFAASRDYSRSLQNLPDSLALFATYNLEAAFDEAGKAMSKSEASQQLLPLMSAVVHAFHSQRAFVAFEQNGNNNNLRGNLAVSFDREGRYTIGDLAARSADFDVANAIIPTKGLSVLQSPRVESMTLRIKAKGAGVAPRVRDDLAKFPWQKVESSNDAQVVVTSAARRIPEKMTVKLPVAGDEFKQYLRPSPRINSVAPEIVALAKQIAGEDKDARSVARKIGEWTYQNLKWKKVESDTVETLASREADCLEHSELYVALARASGLPARVVTGAAFGGGSFGAHAWVEVYLGKWVELDPTWGLMEHVDATHLRFDGDAFTSYAMLNQLELEITAARRTVADFQRDPARLVKEFSLDAATRDLAFDLPLTVEHTLGAERWNQLDEKQRAAVIKAFERAVKELWETWVTEAPEPVRVLRREPKGALLVLTVLRGDALLRLTLAERDGAWFITEHENPDDTLPEFADALNGALQPETKRGKVYELTFEPALKHLDRLIVNEGEKPELLLLKAKVLSLQQSQARIEKLIEASKEAGKDAGPEKPAPVTEEKPATQTTDPAVELMKRIVARRPDFAPGHLALGRELLNKGDTEDSLSPVSKDTEQAITSLRRYAELVPDDPRPWRDLGQAFEQTEQFDEAEKAYRAAIERDRTYLDHHAVLVNFLLDQEALDKAKTAFATMLKVASNPDEAFEYLSGDEEESLDADTAKLREELLLAFPKEVAASKTALLLLAELQEAQDKFAEAVKSMQRAIAIEAEAEDYYRLSRLYRRQRRFTEALNAANQGLTLDESGLYLHFERACSLAQLGRKREALAALKQLAEGDETPFFNADEPDLQPLATMPEF
ncbi:MAG TPA: transglutaminase domain-containing protein, partial [Blastocatellia bacterium]|nr:transglutaminase domain-containing protein [Blastocatellia bacterium]